MWTNLRKAAELTVPTNIEVYKAHANDRGVPNNKVSDTLKVAGLGTGMTGVLGVMGVAMANQAASTVAMYAGMTAAQTSSLAVAGLATSAGSFTAALGSVGTALAGMGSVAVAGASLPVASVVALGAAAAGVTMLAVGKAYSLMKESHNRGIPDAVVDRAFFDPNGREAPKLANWLKAAKSLVVESIQHRFAHKGPQQNDQPVLSAEAIALGDAARLKGVREDQIPKFMQTAQAFIDQAKRDGIDLPALKIFDPKAPSTPAVATPEKTREPRSIDNPHLEKAPKR